MNFTIRADQSKHAFALKPIQGRHLKRALDILLILMALPILIPLALLMVLLIRSVSAGPVLFKQERVGHLGRRFGCFKFRTMLVGADATTHQGHLHRLMNSNVPMTKMDSQGDSRIIPFGRLLRASGLDELPQLINVLRGEMSLVGPRPCLPYEYDQYLPAHKERFGTLPGLTGFWQVSGKNKTTFEKMIQLDVHYVKNQNIWWDLKILLMTTPTLFVQMLEARRVKKAASSPVLPENVFSIGSTLPNTLTTTSGLTVAAVVDEERMRTETELK